MMNGWVVKSLVQTVLSHCQLTVATIVNVPNEQNGTHQAGAAFVVLQPFFRNATPSTFPAQAASVVGSSDANDGAFPAGASPLLSDACRVTESVAAGGSFFHFT